VDELKAYIVGADGNVFDDLWRKAEDTAQDSLSGADAVAGLVSLQIPPEIEPEGLVNLYKGRSGRIDLVRRMILRAGRQESPVLIVGENGAGKGLAARAIHQYGRRSGKPYNMFNCATIGPELLEAELFGDDTDTAAPKRGAWEAVGEGTLVLYGISELSLEHQRQAFRALQDGKIRRVGASDDIDVRARVIAATSRDLHAMVQSGQFREDLYFLLRRFVIRIPALRDHPDDIVMLAQHNWRRYAGIGAALSDTVIKELRSYGWPGNVRELKSVLANLFSLFEDQHPTLEQLRSLQLYRQASAASIDSLPLQGAGLHWISCVEHLQRARDVLAACEFGLHEWMEGPDAGAPGQGTDLATIDRLLHELGDLGNRPLLFHSWPTFQIVHALQGRLKYVYALLQTDRKASRTYWKESVAKSFEPVQDAIESELGRAVSQ
jgi:transcriptional regulator of acetoin/glycerol metabolism